MRAGDRFYQKEGRRKPKLSYNARGHIDTKPVYVYTEQIFVGYYIYIIVAYKKSVYVYTETKTTPTMYIL